MCIVITNGSVYGIMISLKSFVIWRAKSDRHAFLFCCIKGLFQRFTLIQVHYLLSISFTTTSTLAPNMDSSWYHVYRAQRWKDPSIAYSFIVFLVLGDSALPLSSFANLAPFITFTEPIRKLIPLICHLSITGLISLHLRSVIILHIMRLVRRLRKWFLVVFF